MDGPRQHQAEDEETGPVIGVAISRQQTRLLSPTTPTAEKILALEDGAFFDEHTELGEESSQENTVSDTSTKVESNENLKDTNGHHLAIKSSRSDDVRAFLQDKLTRRRSSSGPESSLETLQRAIKSIPKKLSISSPFSSEKRQEEPPPRPQPYRLTTSRTTLRRTVSDESLTIARSLSHAPSLGDDSRFESVQAQVNSRFKAIRDSVQDANIRLPSIALRTDIFKDRPSHSKSTTNLKELSSVQSYTKHEEKEGQHPQLNTALSNLTGDVIVLGGYRGSILRSSTPPHKQLWVPIKVGLNIRKVDLEVGIDEIDDEQPPRNVIPGGMLTHIGPVDISKRLLKKLQTCENAINGKLRIHNYGYDWRLNPHLLSRQLVEFLSNLECNKNGEGATVIAHSLGGLITRHAVNTRPELFKAVVYAGVPTRCVNILGPLRNGDDVLFSSRVLTAQVNFTIRTSFALLPLDGRCFIDKNTREPYDVDFFDPKTWLEYRLSPCIARSYRAITPEANGIVSTVTKALPSLPIHARKFSLSRSAMKVTSAGGVAEPDMMASTQTNETSEITNEIEPNVSTQITIPFKEAYAYLTRMLANVKRFKEELAFRPELVGKYPHISVIYGKNTPTVIGARVDGREGIKRADAYDDLAFASGDGVVLARAAMVPKGYKVIRGGIVSSERGHVSLLGDLEAVGKALNAVYAATVEEDCKLDTLRNQND